VGWVAILTITEIRISGVEMHNLVKAMALNLNGSNPLGGVQQNQISLRDREPVHVESSTPCVI
jgi:hypothetical protein